MRKRIGGKVYDTSMDEEIASWDNALCGNDSKRLKETLFRTVGGDWYLHYEGGPMTPYAPPICIEEPIRGVRIKLMNDVEVRVWCKKNDKPAVLEKYFPDKIEQA